MKYVILKVDYREYNFDFLFFEIDDFLYCIERLNFFGCYIKVMFVEYKYKIFVIFVYIIVFIY